MKYVITWTVRANTTEEFKPLAVDGKVGPVTWDALWRAPIT